MRNSRKFGRLNVRTLGVLSAAGLGVVSAHVALATATTWTGSTATTGSFIVPGNWNNAVPVNSVSGYAFFGSPTGLVNPDLETARSLGELNFTAAGWDITSTGSTGSLTMAGYLAGGGGQACISSLGSGTNEIAVPVTLNSARSIFAGAGNTLLFGSAVNFGSSSNYLSGTGIIQFNAAGTSVSTDHIVFGFSAAKATPDVLLNASNVWGTSAQANGTISAGGNQVINIDVIGGAQTLNNNVTLNGNQATFNINTFTGTQNLNDNGVLSVTGAFEGRTINVGTGTATFNGYNDTDGAVPLTLKGNGTLALSGNNSTATVLGLGYAVTGNATLLIDGSASTATASAVGTIGSTAKLGGIGTIAMTGTGVHSNTISGTLSPGDPSISHGIGTLTFGNGTGTNTLSLPSGSTFNETINSTAITASEVVVNGTVSLGGNLSGTDFAPSTTVAAGTAYTILTSTSPISGVFANKPTSGTSTITIGLNTYTVNYNDGGDNVVLISQASSLITAVWNGASGGTWNSAGNWSPTTIPNAQGATADLESTGAGTITLDAVQTLGTLNINSSTPYTLLPGSGGSFIFDNTGGTGPATLNVLSGTGHAISAPISMASGMTVTTVNGTSLTIGAGGTGTGAISGTGPLIYDGAGTGTLTLSPSVNNSYTGATTISGGILQVGNSMAIPAASSVTDNATLAFNLTSGFTFSNYIGGTGAVTVNAPGSTLVVGGANAFAGGTTLTAGTLQLGSSQVAATGPLGGSTTPGTLTINGGTLDLHGQGGLVVGSLSGTGGIITDSGSSPGVATLTITNMTAGFTFAGAIQDGANRQLALTLNGYEYAVGLTLTGANTYSGTTTINGGNLLLGNGGSAGSISAASAVVVNNNGGFGTGTLEFDRNNSLIFPNAISGTGGIAQVGTGTTTLNGSGNSYSGITTLSAGILQTDTLANGLSNSGIGAASNASGNILFNGGTLRYTGSGASTDHLFNLYTSAGGTLDASGTGALNFTNTNPLGVGLTQYTNGVRTFTLTGTSASNIINTFAPVIPDYTGFPPAASAATSVLKTGSNTWSLSGINTYSGATTVSAGKLNITGTLANTGAVNVNGGSFGGTGTVSVGAVTVAGGANLDLVDGTIGTLNIGNTLTMGGASTSSNFNLELNTVGGTTTFDSVAATNGINVLAGGVIVNLTNLGGTPTPGTYTIASGAIVVSGFNFSNATTTETAFGSTLNLINPTGTAEEVVITSGGSQAVAGITVTAPSTGQRVMANQTLTAAVGGMITNTTGTSPLNINLTSTGTLNVTGLSPNSGTVATGGSTAYTGDLHTGAATGSQSFQITETDATATGSPASASGSVTVLNNRVLSASTVAFSGPVHQGTVEGSTNSTVSSTTGDDSSETRLTFNSTTFNGGGQTTNVSIAPTLSTAGAAPTGSVSVPLTGLTGEGLQGEVDQSSVSVGYTATNVFTGKAQWTGAADTTWSNNSNWTDTASTATAGAPGLAGALSAADTATFVGASPITVSLNVSPSVAAVSFTGTGGTSISAGGGTLTLSNGASAASVNVSNGSSSIAAPIALTSTGVNVTFANSSALTVTSAISGTGPIAVGGLGKLTVTAGNLPSASTLAVGTGAKVALAIGGSAATQNLAGLTVDTTTGSQFDVGNNIVNISYSGSSPIATIAADITSGYAGGAWNGAGINSSAVVDTHHGVGYLDNGSGNIEVRYTLLGDTDLSGSINFNDLLTLAQHYGQSNVGWAQGDTDYNNSINFNDLLSLAQNYGQSVPAGSSEFSPSFASEWNLAVAEANSVPEPTSLGLLAIGAMGLMARRRRNVSAR